MSIVGICGSLSHTSGNLELLSRARELSQGQVVLFEGLGQIPHFNPDLEKSCPVEVVSLRQALAASSGVVIASPEYGHSLPGSLKNAIDWVIGSGELYQKPVAITAAVTHATRGLRGLAALETVLRAVDATLVWNAPIVIEQLGEELPRLLRALRAAND